MFRILAIFFLGILVVRGIIWDQGLDGELLGDIPRPTPEPGYIIPDYLPGSVPIQPVHLGKSLPRPGLLEHRQVSAFGRSAASPLFDRITQL